MRHGHLPGRARGTAEPPTKQPTPKARQTNGTGAGKGGPKRGAIITPPGNRGTKMEITFTTEDFKTAAMIDDFSHEITGKVWLQAQTKDGSILKVALRSAAELKILAKIYAKYAISRDAI